MTGQALVTAGSTHMDALGAENLSEFVTFNIAGQLFGIPVLIVQDILVPENIASVPLAPPEVRGSINLRGRIVTVIDVRIRLGLERRSIRKKSIVNDVSEAEAPALKVIEGGIDKTPEDAPSNGDAAPGAAQNSTSEESAHAAIEAVKRKKRQHMMGVTVEHQHELYTLLVDSVGNVINLPKNGYESNPTTLDPLWRDFSNGVYRLEGALMVVLDVERLLDFKAQL